MKRNPATRIENQHHRRSRNPLISCPVLAVAFAMAVLSPSPATTPYVSQTSPNPTPPYATWDTAAHTVQDGVDAANEGDTVLVGPGQYGLTNQVTVSKGIALRSSMGANQTFLNSLGDVWCLWVSNSAAIIDGFTMQKPSTVSGFDQAGGAFLAGGTVENCNFTNFYSPRLGESVIMNGGTLSNSVVIYTDFRDGPNAAVYCSDGGQIVDCQVLGIDPRRGSFGIGVYLVDAQLKNSRIFGVWGAPGASAGEAVYALSSTISGCTITRNGCDGQGGGAYLDGCFMDRCIVYGNACYGGLAGTGGGGLFETNSMVRNSLIVSNNAATGAPETPDGGFGGGVYMQGGALVNCTVTRNSALSCAGPPPVQGEGAGVYVENGGITNCIIYSNFFYCAATPSSGSEWFNAGPGIFDHCCTTPDLGGTGNILQDPQFLDPANGDYHLGSNSVCIAAGLLQSWMTGAFDLDGNPRITNGVVDMGAYQSPFAALPPPTPQQQAEFIISEVDRLVAQKTLNHAEGKALVRNLEAAIRSMNAGSTASACEEVREFTERVHGLMQHKRLSPPQALALIDVGESLRAALGCADPSGGR